MEKTAPVTKVVVTGANGFIGKPLVERLARQPHYQVVAVLRRPDPTLPNEVTQHLVSDLLGYQGWLQVLQGCDLVIHAAARAHILSDHVLDPLSEFRKTNRDATMQLLDACLQSQVKRFIFLSSIGVHGTESITPFTVFDQPCPREPYAISKLEAENSLKSRCQNTNLAWTIIRPPLVYGPNAKGNVDRLFRFVSRRIPLPLGAIDNKRSLVALDNLLDFIQCCAEHPNAANQTFLVSDGEDVSTTELIKVIAKALKVRTWLLPIPTSWIMLAAKLLGKQAMARRLCNSLQVDMSHTQQRLGWQPVVSLQQAMARLVMQKEQAVEPHQPD